MSQPGAVARDDVAIRKPILYLDNGIAACRVKFKEFFDNWRGVRIRFASLALAIPADAAITYRRRGRLPAFAGFLNLCVARALAVNVGLPLGNTCENVGDKARSFSYIPLKHRDHFNAFGLYFFPGVAKVGDIAREAVYLVDNQRVNLIFFDLRDQLLEGRSLGSAAAFAIVEEYAPGVIVVRSRIIHTRALLVLKRETLCCLFVGRYAQVNVAGVHIPRFKSLNLIFIGRCPYRRAIFAASLLIVSK